MYRLEGEDLWLNPTAEVPVTNIFRDEILEPGALPLRLTAYCPSFRREAGAYGKDTRGIVRLHQFDKVELVRFCLPERSYEEHEELRRDVEDVLQTSSCPTASCCCAAATSRSRPPSCYDFEAYAAGEGRWLEVSSCSNFEQFQARRAGIRFRREAGPSEPWARSTPRGWRCRASSSRCWRTGSGRRLGAAAPALVRTWAGRRAAPES